MQKLFQNFAFRTTLIYVIFAGLWIYSSDWILGFLVNDPNMMTYIAMIKGWFFVAVTASILYIQVAREWKIREKQEQEIRQLNVELEQRVKIRTTELEAALQELEAFNYSVSHDLRAPLRAIDGFSQILIEDYTPQLDEKGLNYLKRMYDASHYMGQLIDALLQLSKVNRTPLNRISVDLSQMASEIIKDLYSERLNVSWNIIPNLIVDADPALIRIVLVNLLGNAYKYTGLKEKPEIKMGKVAKDGKDWFYIQDNGVGFDMSQAQSLFQAFHRLHAGFEGTGIGLALVHRIIQRHEGEIFAEAKVNQGATFYFYV